MGGDLLQQVVAADQVLGAFVAERGDHLLDLLAHRGEEAGAALGGAVDLLRGELLQPVLLGFLGRLDLGGDADVAGVELAAAADRAAEADHRQGAEADPVGAEAVQFDDVVAGAVAAVGPDLDPVAQPGLHQRPVHGAGADVRGQADVAQRVLAGGAGAALEAGEGDDVGAGLGDPEADRADVRHHRDLDRDAHVRVDGLQLVDQLGQVLDRVEVVVVGGRDQVGAGRRVTGGGDLLGDLLAGQVAALAGLGALADLDLGQVGGVEHLGRDAEAPRGDLLAAPLAVVPVHVADLATLAVDAEDVGRLGRLRVGAEGRLGLRAEAHRGDHDRVVVVADAGVDAGRVDRLAVALQAHDVAHRDRALLLEVADFLRVVLVGAGAVGGRDRGLVDLRVEAERLRRFGRLVVAAEGAGAGVGVLVEVGEAGAALGRGGEGLGLEDLGQLRLDPDRGELAGVAADLVDADRRDHFLDPLGQGGAEVADVGLVVLDADHLDHHVGADAVGAEPEGQHHVVDVADRGRAQDDPAAAAQVLLAGLDPELLQRLVDRRGRQVRVEVAALAVVDGAVGEDQQLGPVADLLHRFLLDPLDRAAGRLRLQQRDVDGGGAAAELLPEVLEQVGVVLAGDPAVGLVGERRQAVVAAEDHREGGFDRAGVLAGGVERGPAAEQRRGSRSARSRARGRSPGW